MASASKDYHYWNAKGGESLGDKESSEEEKEVSPALILASGARPLAPDVTSVRSCRQEYQPRL
jgi:hypothetical protein